MVFDLNKIENEMTNKKKNGLLGLSFTYNGNDYYYKVDKDSEYTYNELIAKKIADRLGIDCCDYYLASYHNTSGVVSQKFDTTNYISLSDILTKYSEEHLNNYQHSSGYDNENNLEDIWNAFDRIFDEDTTARLMDELVDIFLFDVLIGNVDRHNENLGIILDKKKPRFAPLFDNEEMLSEDSIIDGEYCIGIERGDAFGYNFDPQQNLIYKFLNLSDSMYKERLMQMIPVISENSLKKIFEELESEGIKIPKETIDEKLKKFKKNREMIEKYFILNRSAINNEFFR